MGSVLDLTNGIFSHDTLNLFFRMADAAALVQYLRQWVREVVSLAEARIISIDGKTLSHTITTRDVNIYALDVIILVAALQNGLHPIWNN